MPFNLGGPELIVILVIVLIVFGAGKLPNVMKDVGRGVKEFKRAQNDEEVENAMPTSTTTHAAPPAPVTSASTTSAASNRTSGTNGTATTAVRPTETSSRA